MPQKSTKKSDAVSRVNGDSKPGSLFSKSSSLDPSLSSLFSSSAGPLQAPVKHYTPTAVKRKDEYITAGDGKDPAHLKVYGTAKDYEADEADEASDDDDDDDDDDEELSELSELDSDEDDALVDDDDEGDPADVLSQDETEEQTLPERPRKRKAKEDDLEGVYLQKLAHEDGRAAYEDRQTKRQKVVEGSRRQANGDDDGDGSDSDDLGPPPVHETLAPSKDDGSIDKAARTVFLGNVSNEAILSKSAKRTLLQHLASHLKDLPADAKNPHKVESLRFRSTAFGGKIPKKAAFARKDLMDATAKSTNAYAVYTSRAGARGAARSLNGTVVLGRHLRVDEVAHPARTDHRRCVFVGNLGFVDDESAIKAAEADAGYKGVVPKALKGDVEEGLWLQFGKAGRVESVRVVRDAKTRVGKGFAYVQFADENAVEAALLFDDKKYPPLLPRKLRVTRAKKPSTTARARDAPAPGAAVPKRNQAKGQVDGRAGKLFGRAGAASARSGGAPAKGPAGLRKPESYIFEGHRASSKQGNTGLKLGGKGGRAKKGVKPTGRSAKRGAAWKSKAKESGGKKA